MTLTEMKKLIDIVSGCFYVTHEVVDFVDMQDAYPRFVFDIDGCVITVEELK